MSEEITEPGVVDYQAAERFGDDENARALASMLAARPPEPETDSLYMRSIDAHVVVRELTETEFEEWQENFIVPLTGMQGKARKRGRFEAMAHLVALALVSPLPSAAQLHQAGYAALADFLRSRLKPLEIVRLGGVVTDLSGGSEDQVERGKG